VRPTPEQRETLARLGFKTVEDPVAAIQCATSPSDTFASVTFDALISHAKRYQLCACGSHKPYAKDLSHECGDCGADVGAECSYNCSTNWI